MKRRAFTLIEILIVIGVIGLLVAVVAMSFSRVGDSAKGRETVVTLGNLKGMVAELEATAGLRGRQPRHLWVNGAMTPPGTAMDAWKDANPVNTADPEPDALIVPTGVNNAATRFDSDAVRNTQLLMMQVAQAPKNRTSLSALPSGSAAKLPNLPEDSAYKTDLDESKEVGVPIDAWGNPIIFVPAGGLCGNATTPMWVGGEPNADGAKQVVAEPASTTQVAPIRAPDGRPFWASAGPDGDFTRGDDNVYSF